MESTIKHTSPPHEIPANQLAKILFGKPIDQVVRDMQTDADHPLLATHDKANTP